MWKKQVILFISFHLPLVFQRFWTNFGLKITKTLFLAISLSVRRSQIWPSDLKLINSSLFQKKIDKRGRKLVDFDGQRHSFQALQTSMKKRDEAKINKGREQLEEAKRTYEILNSELHDELPALYDSRVLFLVTNLQSLFNSEHTFHSEAAKVR